MVVFRYKPFRGRLTPIITVGVRIGAKWYPVEAYVDSGSAYTVLHAQIAEGKGLIIKQGIRSISRLEMGASSQSIYMI